MLLFRLCRCRKLPARKAQSVNIPFLSALPWPNHRRARDRSGAHGRHGRDGLGRRGAPPRAVAFRPRPRPRRDPPPPFGTQLANPSPASGVPSAVEPSVDGAESAAPLADGAEDSPLQRVSDQYAPGWTEIDARQVRSMRRSLAARSNASHTATTAVATPGSQVQGVAAGQATPGVGGTGRRWLHLQAEVTGTWSYVLQYASPYDPMSKPVSTFTIEATVRPAPASENRRRLLEVDLDDDSPSPLGRGI